IARPVASARTAPSTPPELEPMTSGDASGLRNSPCICAPATASPAPTSAATMTRGVRINQTIICCGSATSLTSIHPCGREWEANPPAAHAAETGELPMAIPAMNPTHRRIVTVAKYPPTRCVRRPRDARAIRAGGASIVLVPISIDPVGHILDEAHDVVRDGQKMAVVNHDDAPGARGLTCRDCRVFEQSVLHEFFLASVCARNKKVRLPFDDLLRIDLGEALDSLLRADVDSSRGAHNVIEDRVRARGVAQS